MNNDDAYAVAHNMERDYKLAEIRAFEATCEAQVARRMHEWAESYELDRRSVMMADVHADELEAEAERLEYKAQRAYDAWAAYTTENNL